MLTSGIGHGHARHDEADSQNVALWRRRAEHRLGIRTLGTVGMRATPGYFATPKSIN
jgi:hypothetical protein